MFVLTNAIPRPSSKRQVCERLDVFLVFFGKPLGVEPVRVGVELRAAVESPYWEHYTFTTTDLRERDTLNQG